VSIAVSQVVPAAWMIVVRVAAPGPGAVAPAERRPPRTLRGTYAAHAGGLAALPGRAGVRLSAHEIASTLSATSPAPAPDLRVAPHTRPGGALQTMFTLVRVLQCNPLRSRVRRFESCRGHWSEHKLERSANLGATSARACDLRKRRRVRDLAPRSAPETGPQPRKAQLSGQNITTATRPLPLPKAVALRPGSAA
jgi:hypothetical protein